MEYYCPECKEESSSLGDLTGKDHENPKADYLSGETCECGGTIDAY